MGQKICHRGPRPKTHSQRGDADPKATKKATYFQNNLVQRKIDNRRKQSKQIEEKEKNKKKGKITDCAERYKNWQKNTDIDKPLRFCIYRPRRCNKRETTQGPEQRTSRKAEQYQYKKQQVVQASNQERLTACGGVFQKPERKLQTGRNSNQIRSREAAKRREGTGGREVKWGHRLCQRSGHFVKQPNQTLRTDHTAQTTETQKKKRDEKRGKVGGQCRSRRAVCVEQRNNWITTKGNQQSLGRSLSTRGRRV